MRTIYAEYNINYDSVDVYTSAGYMLRIECWETEKNLKTAYGSECALTSLGFQISRLISSFHSASNDTIIKECYNEIVFEVINSEHNIIKRKDDILCNIKLVLWKMI